LCGKCLIQNKDQILCIHGRRYNTCGNCIRKRNEKMNRRASKFSSNIKSSRKVTKSNSTVITCDIFCEHFESVELCKECLKNTKLHQDPVYLTDNIGMFN
jgi:hypothetical protein